MISKTNNYTYTSLYSILIQDHRPGFMFELNWALLCCASNNPVSPKLFHFTSQFAVISLKRFFFVYFL